MEPNRHRRFARGRLIAAAIGAAIIIGGCTSGGARMRFGAYFGSPFGMPFPSPDKLGHHNSHSGIGENNGMVYTCKGGFIDIGHVREAADRTAYIAEIAQENLAEGKKQFSFRVIEPSRYWIKVSYPENWNTLSQPEKDRTVKEVSILMGQYLAHRSLVWHEIMTWYGFSIAGIFPETISSFSCEDPYSDVLGTHLGVEALRDNGHRYNEAMTRLLDEALKELDVQPASVAHRARDKVRGQWYTGGFYFFVNMKKHNFDAGLDDGLISPMLVSGMCPNAEALPWPVPRLESIARYGFGMHVEIEPLIWQKDKIWHSIGLARNVSRVDPEVYFPAMVDAIKKSDRTSR
jgi:hypothetical protein